MLVVLEILHALDAAGTVLLDPAWVVRPLLGRGGSRLGPGLRTLHRRRGGGRPLPLLHRGRGTCRPLIRLAGQLVPSATFIPLQTTILPAIDVAITVREVVR